MYELTAPLNVYVKPKPVSICSNVSKLHYKVTPILIYFAVFIIFFEVLFGKPITCVTQGMPQETVDLYCWINPTFTVRRLWDNKNSNSTFISGIGPLPTKEELKESNGEEPLKYYPYYFWIPFVLFLQATCFHLIGQLWKIWEGNLIISLVKELKTPLQKEDERKSNLEQIVEYFKFNRGKHFLYAFKFYLAEIIYLLNLIFQFWFTNYFFDYEFHSFGSGFWSTVGAQSSPGFDPWAKIFPKVTKCLFRNYGPSGTIQLSDHLCVMTHNILNEKIYFVFWVWLVFLTVVTSLYLIYKLVVICMPELRLHFILFYGARKLNYQEVYELLNPDKLNCLQKFGDWFLLNLLFSNLDSITVNEIVDLLVKNERDHSNSSNNIIKLPQSYQEGPNLKR